MDLGSPAQGGTLGQLGHQHQAQRGDEGGGQVQQGQGHAEHDPESGDGGGDLHPAGHQPLGNEDGAHRAHQIAQQGGQADGYGDVKDAAVQDPAGLAAAPVRGQAAGIPPVEEREGAGGKDLADHHARHNEPHGPLGALGEEEHQQPQHRHGAHQLLQHLRACGRTDQARAVEGVLVEVFHPGEEKAG